MRSFLGKSYRTQSEIPRLVKMTGQLRYDASYRSLLELPTPLNLHLEGATGASSLPGIIMQLRKLLPMKLFKPNINTIT
jgi:hypothetical protein